jgi:hypothetical protein
MTTYAPVAAESWALDDDETVVRAATVDDAIAGMAGWEPQDVPPADRVHGISHLLDTSMTSAGHISRHLDAIKNAQSSDSLDYNIKHCENHVSELINHLGRAIAAIADQYPEVGAELDRLHRVTRLDRTTSGRGAGGDYDVVMPGSRGGPEPA